MGFDVFDIHSAIGKYSEKKGYTEGVKYYFKMIKSNRAVRNSQYFPIVKRFDAALNDFVAQESTTALVDLTNILPEFYGEEGLPDVFVAEGLEIAFNCISEYLMHLSELYHLDYYL